AVAILAIAYFCVCGGLPTRPSRKAWGYLPRLLGLDALCCPHFWCTSLWISFWVLLQRIDSTTLTPTAQRRAPFAPAGLVGVRHAGREDRVDAIHLDAENRLRRG